MKLGTFPKRTLYIDEENFDWLARRAAEKKLDSVSAVLRQLLDEVRQSEEAKKLAEPKRRKGKSR